MIQVNWAGKVVTNLAGEVDPVRRLNAALEERGIEKRELPEGEVSERDIAEMWAYFDYGGGMSFDEAMLDAQAWREAFQENWDQDGYADSYNVLTGGDYTFEAAFIWARTEVQALRAAPAERGEQRPN